jgi:hypothetical protein
MRLEKAKKLKQSILSEYYKEVIGVVSPALRAQNEPPIPRSDRRIAVGLAKVDRGYRVEIRIQRAGGAAEELTKGLQRKYGDGINVEVLQRLEIPPFADIKRYIADPERRRTKVPRSARQCRPLEIGCSVGHPEGGPGTLGAIIEFKKGKKGDGVLSNAHVFVPNDQVEKGHRIYQPGREKHALSVDERIGKLQNWIVLQAFGANDVDAAVARLDDGIAHNGNVIPETCKAPCAGEKIRGYQSALELPPRAVLAKVGRTTDYTEGVLTGAAIDDVTVLYHGAGNLRFDNLLEITWRDLKSPFARPGDSGALVFNPKTMMAVGLHFAGGVVVRNGKQVGVSYACDITSVLDSLACRLVL